MANNRVRNRKISPKNLTITLVFFFLCIFTLLFAKGIGQEENIYMFRLTFISAAIFIIIFVLLTYRILGTEDAYLRKPDAIRISRLSNIVIASSIFLILVIIMFITRNDIAIGGNERREWEYTSTVIYWFDLLFKKVLFSKPIAEISRISWPYGHFYHPPFARYIFSFGYLLFQKLMPPLETYRMGSGMFFALSATILYIFIAKQYGRWSGICSVLSLIFIPVVFTHAHFVGTDIPIAVMWLLCVVSYYYATTLKRKILFAALFGCALLTKIQAVFIPIPLILWSYYLHRVGKDNKSPVSWSLFFSVLIVTSLTLFLGWPWLWHKGIERFIGYLYWVVTVTKDGTAYFGRVYGANYAKTPWHYPFITLLSTVPLPILAAGCIGIAAAFKNRRNDDCGVFLLFNMAVSLLIISFLGGWEGSREFLISFFLLAAFAGIGFAVCWGYMIKRFHARKINLRGKFLKAAFVILIFTPIAAHYSKIYPYGLFYYNGLIGGLNGAKRAGFGSYWDNELGKDLLNFINRNLEQNARLIYNQGTNISMKWYQEMGRIRKDIILDNEGNFRKYLSNPSGVYYITNNMDSSLYKSGITPVFSLKYDNISLLQVWKVEDIARRGLVKEPSSTPHKIK